jgi:hypothetical protein
MGNLNKEDLEKLFNELEAVLPQTTRQLYIKALARRLTTTDIIDICHEKGIGELHISKIRRT